MSSALPTCLPWCCPVCKIQSLFKIGHILRLVRTFMTWFYTQEGIYCKSWMTPKHKLMGRKTGTFVVSRVVCIHQRRYVSFRVRLLVLFQSTKHIKECLVETFWHSIAHRMIRSSPCLIFTGNGTQLLNNLAFEVATLVTVEERREPIMGKKNNNKKINVSNRSLAVVLAVLFREGMAWAYLVKWSLITRMCSYHQRIFPPTKNPYIPNPSDM